VGSNAENEDRSDSNQGLPRTYWVVGALSMVAAVVLLVHRISRGVFVLQETEPALLVAVLVNLAWYPFWWGGFTSLVRRLALRGTLISPDRADLSIRWYVRVAGGIGGWILFGVGTAASLASYLPGGFDQDTPITIGVRTVWAGVVGWMLWLPLAAGLAARNFFRTVPLAIDPLHFDGHGGLASVGTQSAQAVLPSLTALGVVAFLNSPKENDPTFQALLLSVAVLAAIFGSVSALVPLLAAHKVLSRARDVQGTKILALIRELRSRMIDSLQDGVEAEMKLAKDRYQLARRLETEVARMSTWPLALVFRITIPLAQLTTLVTTLAKVFGYFAKQPGH
jgi:hypothetical protein